MILTTRNAKSLQVVVDDDSSLMAHLNENNRLYYESHRRKIVVGQDSRRGREAWRLVLDIPSTRQVKVRYLNGICADLRRDNLQVLHRNGVPVSPEKRTVIVSAGTTIYQEQYRRSQNSQDEGPFVPDPIQVKRMRDMILEVMKPEEFNAWIQEVRCSSYSR